MAGIGWSEDQVKATIKAYFALLSNQESGSSVKKSEIYKELAQRFPGRSAKAFALKFQNISAVLYEESLPYCDGLKPRFNYQNLLRLLVLDRLKRSPIPVQEPHTILFRKLSELKSRGYIKVEGKSTGRFGLAIEKWLGIPPNSSKSPDFMGIELKTKFGKTLQTLFSRTPSRYTGVANKTALVGKYGYHDPVKNRQALYTSFSSTPDPLGFQLTVKRDRIVVVHSGVELLEFDAERIEAALLSKHSQTAFVALSKRVRKGKEECRVESATYCKGPSIIRFLRLVESNRVYLDFTISQKGAKVKDHGFLWRIRSDAVSELYLYNEEQSLGEV